MTLIKESSFKHNYTGSVLFFESPKQGVFVYKKSYTNTSIIDGGKHNGRVISHQGFVDERDLPSLINKLHFTPEEQSGWTICSPKLLEIVKTYGWSGEKNDFVHFEKYVSETPYDDLINKKGMFLRIDRRSDMIFDLNDEPFPIAINFNYIDGNIDSNHYNLVLLKSVLLKRNDISITIDNELIPYYNNDDGRTRHSGFTWAPSTEDYRAIWKECIVAGKKEYPSTYLYQAVFNLDLLGLRAGRAALTKEYWKQ